MRSWRQKSRLSSAAASESTKNHDLPMKGCLNEHRLNRITPRAVALSRHDLFECEVLTYGSFQPTIPFLQLPQSGVRDIHFTELAAPFVKNRILKAILMTHIDNVPPLCPDGVAPRICLKPFAYDPSQMPF